MISSYKKLYGKQPVEFPITEHIFGKIRPNFLKIEFLKGGTLLYFYSRRASFPSPSFPVQISKESAYQRKWPTLLGYKAS